MRGPPLRPCPVPEPADSNEGPALEDSEPAEGAKAPEDPEPADTGTGLAPTPHGALPAAVNVFAIVATAVATLGIVAGLRSRP